MSTGLPRPGLARTAHRGQIKLLIKGICIQVQRQDRAIKLHPFTVLMFHLTLYSNISKFSTLYTTTFPLTLGAHAQRRLHYIVLLCVCVCVCLSVYLSICLFVYDYSRTTGYEAAYERYQQLQCYKGKKNSVKNSVAILLKPLRSRDMA